MKKLLKRAFAAAAALFLVLVIVSAGVLVSAFWGNAPLPDAADLPGGVRLVKDGMVALFVVPVGERQVALVDCGNDPEARRVLAELERRHLGPGDVRAIFLTHGHGDHVAGCARFPGAEVMALAPDVGLASGAEHGHGLLGRLFRNRPPRTVKVTRVLHDGETVRVGAVDVRVFAVPGHTPGSAAYLANGVLFLGDSATDREDGTFAGAPRPLSDDVRQNHASLRALWSRLRGEQLAVEALAPAHSAPRTGVAAFEAFARGSD